MNMLAKTTLTTYFWYQALFIGQVLNWQKCAEIWL